MLIRYRAQCNDNVFLGRRNEQMEDLLRKMLDWYDH